MKTGIVQKALAFPVVARQSALAKNRPALSRSEFVDSIIQSGGDPEAAEFIHSHLQDWIYHKGFTPYPNDSLSSVFGIAEEELDEDLILNLLVKLSLPVPSQQEVSTFGSINTPTDIARLVTLARSGKQVLDLRS